MHHKDWNERKGLTSNLDQLVLLHYILHLLLFLLLLDRISLHVGDLKCYFLVSIPIGGAESQASQEMGGGIFERLVVLPTYTLAW